MEEEGFPGQFKKLEGKLEELVQAYLNVQQTKSELEAKILDLEGVIKIKAAEEERYVEEKSIIRGKIEGLLNKLDQHLSSK